MSCKSWIRKLIYDNSELRKEIENLRADTDGKFRIVFEALDQLLTVESKPKKKIGFTVKEKLSGYGKPQTGNRRGK